MGVRSVPALHFIGCDRCAVEFEMVDGPGYTPPGWRSVKIEDLRIESTALYWFCPPCADVVSTFIATKV